MNLDPKNGLFYEVVNKTRPLSLFANPFTRRKNVKAVYKMESSSFIKIKKPQYSKSLSTK